MSFANCCQVCDVRTPAWRLDRRGDAVVSWACPAHLHDVVADLQRAWECTEIVVSPVGVRADGGTDAPIGDLNGCRCCDGCDQPTPTTTFRRLAGKRLCQPCYDSEAK